MVDKMNYLREVDKIVFSAYQNGGCCVLSWADEYTLPIADLLHVYGRITEDRLFVIGKDGVEYVMRGGYEGINKEILLNREEAITSIATSKEANKIARDSNRIAVTAIYVSLGALIVSVLSMLISFIFK